MDWDGLCCCSAGPSLLVLSHHGSHVIFGKTFARLSPNWGSYLILFFSHGHQLKKQSRFHVPGFA